MENSTTKVKDIDIPYLMSALDKLKSDTLSLDEQVVFFQKLVEYKDALLELQKKQNDEKDVQLQNQATVIETLHNELYFFLKVLHKIKDTAENNKAISEILKGFDIDWSAIPSVH